MNNNNFIQNSLKYLSFNYCNKSKFLILLLVSLFLLNSYVFAQDIVIRRPRADETLQKGKMYIIKWQTTGKINKNVSILLTNVMKNGIEKIINPKVVNKGSYNWYISKDIPDGNYRIKIEINDNSYSAYSNIFFIGNKENIKNKKIIILNPPRAKIEEICKGDYLNLEWKNISYTDNINIKILKLNNSNSCDFNFYPDPIINKSIPDTGTYRYMVPQLFLGGMYRIKFTRGKETTYSNCFRILSYCSADPADIEKLKKYKFKSIIAKINSKYPLKEIHVLLNLENIIRKLNNIKHGKFLIYFLNSNDKKNLLYILEKKEKWEAEHLGKIAIVNLNIDYEFSNPMIKIFDLDRENVVNSVNIKIMKRPENKTTIHKSRIIH